MEYEKEALSFEAQADRLLERGLIADRDELIQRLSSVSYYRLSGYLYPYRQEGSDSFREGTRLQEVWNRYCFDRRLRVLMLDAIERIEVSIRTKTVYHFSHTHGPFGYCDVAAFPKMKNRKYLEWRLSLQEETDRSKELFRKHFFEKYTAHADLPIWMLAELMSMGSLLTMIEGMAPAIKRQIAADFGLPDELFRSWVRSLYAARNVCAHHARFWNRVHGYPPMLPNPKTFPSWHGEHKLRNDRSGILIMMCWDFLRKISPTSRWRERVEALFGEYPEVPTINLGLPADWMNHPIWKP